MSKDIRFGYFYRKDYFTPEFKEFNLEYLNNKSNKFVQLYINKKPFIVAGDDLYHRDILKLYLEKFNIKFDTRLNVSKDQVPLERGENYEMAGAGRVKFIDGKLFFYDNSSDYIAMFPQGTNKKHLEDFFLGNKIEEGLETHHGRLSTLSFFVEFNNGIN